VLLLARGDVVRGEEPPRADLTVVVGAAPRTFDPHRAVDSIEARVSEPLFEGLVRADPDTGRPVPGLAEAWETTPDGRRWTFRLRDGLRWSDGSGITARDCAWSWRRALSAETAAEYAYLFARVRHADAWSRSAKEREGDGRAPPSAEAVAAARTHFGVDQGVFAADDRTLVFELDGFVPWFLDLLALPLAAPVHRASVERNGERAFFPGRLVGNGAFRLEEDSTPSRLRLRKNAAYWDAASTGCETVDFVTEEEGASAFDRYARGDADWLTSVDAATAARRTDLVQSATGVVYFLRIETRRRALLDARVRRALAHAIDRERVVAASPGGVPSAHFVPAGHTGYPTPDAAPRHDVAEARRLLAAAGFPEGKGFPRLVYLLNTDEGHLRIAREVCRQWKDALGIEAVPEAVEWQGFLERTQSGDYDVSRAGWIADVPDPANYLHMFRTGDPDNRTGWSDPRYDRLLEVAADPVAGSKALAGKAGDAFFAGLRDPAAARALFDPAGDLATVDRRARLERWRLRLLSEAEAILVGDGVPVIPLHAYVNRQLVSPRVEGFRRLLRDADGAPRPNLGNVHPLRALRVRAR
jgi:ABC-type oligopeptide transport system substrate-binding subunit